MKINSLLSFIKKHADFGGKISDSKVSESVFSMLTDYLKKADTSKDNILSSEELSELYDKHSEDILASFKLLLEELENADESSSQELTDTFFGLSKELIEANDFANIDLTDIENITKEDFLKNAKDEDLHNEKLGRFWGIIGESDPGEIFDKIDEDGDGKLSKEELNKFALADGNADNLSITDLSALVDQKVLLENANEVLGNTEEYPEVNPTDTTEETQDTQPTNPASPSTPSNGGNYDSGNSGNSGDVTPTVPDSKERTVEQINAEIKEQETSKTELKTKAEGEIDAEQKKIDDAVKDSDLSDDFKKEYESENKRLDEEISNKDKEIEEQNSAYQDYSAQADALKTAISDISSQISELEGKMGSLEGEDSADLKAKYQTSIDNLNAEKEKLEADEQTAREKADEAKEKAEALKGEKADLEKEKDEILDTLGEKFKDEKDKAEKIKEDVKEYQDNIKTIRAELEKNVATVDANIQKLKNEKAQVEQAPKTKEIISANKPFDRTPTAISGDIQNVNWEDYGYNPETGKKFADSAANVESRLNAKGIAIDHNCLGGVKDTFIDVTGESPFGKPEQGITVASKCLDTMRNHEGYREITGISANDLQHLPAGAVVVWTSSSSGSSPADKYGHISISLGDGRESSSKVRQQLRSVGQNGKPYVFIPIG